MGEIAIPITLEAWQDPQGDVVLKYSRQECIIFFGCWISSAEPADYIGELTFEQAWAVRGVCTEYMPYRIKGKMPHSCIFEIQTSIWLDEASEQRVKSYPNWRKWDRRTYHHYVVDGHDNYYEILASGFSEGRVPRKAN